MDIAQFRAPILLIPYHMVIESSLPKTLLKSGLFPIFPSKDSMNRPHHSAN